MYNFKRKTYTNKKLVYYLVENKGGRKSESS